MISPAVTRSMVTQLDRVRRAIDDDPYDEIERLWGIIGEKTRRIEELQRLIASYEDGGATLHAPSAAPKKYITMREAALEGNVDISTAWRYCNSRHWRSTKEWVNERYVWKVEADNDFKSKPPRKKVAKNKRG